MHSSGTPALVEAILQWPWTWPIARLALVAMFLASGLSKLVNFPAGVAEMKDAGLPAPVVMAVLSLVVELGGSGLVLANRWVWLGAGMLGVFTAIGAFTAHAPWRVPAAARKETTAVFFMHFGLVAAFALDAILAHGVGKP